MTAPSQIVTGRMVALVPMLTWLPTLVSRQRPRSAPECTLSISTRGELYGTRSFLGKKRPICSQKVVPNLRPLQLVLNPATTVSPHLFSKLGLVHQLGDSFREFSFVVRFNIDGSVSSRKSRFFQIERDDRFCRRHVFHNLDPSGHVVQRAGRVGIHANIRSRKVSLQVFIRDEAC